MKMKAMLRAYEKDTPNKKTKFELFLSTCETQKFRCGFVKGPNINLMNPVLITYLDYRRREPKKDKPIIEEISIEEDDAN